MGKLFKRLLSIAMVICMGAMIFPALTLANANYAGAPNLLGNGGFETFADGVFSGWSKSDTFTPAQAPGRTGSAAQLTGRGQPWASLQQDITLANLKYRRFYISAWVKGGEFFETGETAGINVEGRNSAGAKLSPEVNLHMAKVAINNTEWTHLSTEVYIASTITNVDLIGRLKVYVATTKKSDLLVDDFEVKQLPNPILNPGFETGTFANWGTHPVNHNWSVTTEDTHTGTYAAKSVNGEESNTQINQVNLFAEPGVWYSYEFYAKIGAYATVRVRNNDSAGDNVPGTGTLNLTANNRWTKYTIEFQGPSLSSVKLYIAESGTGTNYFDDFSIRKIDGPTLQESVITLEKVIVDGADFTAAENISNPGPASVTVSFRNNAAAPAYATGIVACYEEGVLEAVSVSSKTQVPANATLDLKMNLDIPDTIQDGVFKAFVFDSLTGIKPYDREVYKTIIPAQ